LKLISFAINETDSIGAVIDDVIVDLQPAVQEHQKQTSNLDLKSDFPTEIPAFLLSEGQLLKMCQDAVNWVQVSSFEVPSTSFLHALSEVKINPPISNPGKIVCVGLNYTGPNFVTHDEIGDPHQLSIKCWVNGELRQDSNTDQLVFRIPELIAFISKTCTLLPGDILCTGTPGGVGVFREPPVFLKPGDVVEIEIDRLGHLSNPIK